jgi:translin
VTSGGGRGLELAPLARPVLIALEAAHTAREAGLAATRRTIRSCGLAIRAVHRDDPASAKALTAEAEVALREAQEALRPFPAVAYAGFLGDAEKEFAEACLTAALVQGSPLPGYETMQVEVTSWLKGLAEAASELRRFLLDRLRAGELTRAETLLIAMDEIYGLLITIDYPDALTGGLRRSTDALRAVLERTRGDLTTTVLQARLQAAIESHLSPEVKDDP